LQDCKDDYRDLDRVYVPLDLLAAQGTGVEALGEPRASPALLAALHNLAERSERLLCDSDVFPLLINDRRLALEVSVINTLAHRLTRLLTARDPLSERVQLAMPAVAGLTLLGMFRGASRRLGRRFTAATQKPRGA
jgi:phytoene/squalene synthetase